MEKLSKKQKTFFTVLGVSGAVYGVFRFLLPLAAPFLAAWALTAIFRPSACWISRTFQYHFRIPHIRRTIHIGIPAGIAGCTELLLILSVLSVLLFQGGQLLLQESTVLLEQLPLWADQFGLTLTEWCHQLEPCLHMNENGLILLLQQLLQELLLAIKKGVMPFIMTNSMSVVKFSAGLILFLLLTFIATGMLIQEYDQWQRKIAHSVFRTELNLIISRISQTIGAWLKTQLVLLLIISSICTSIFWYLDNPFFILTGIGTGLLDALPLFGTGTILIPWALVSFLTRQWKKGILLLLLYLVCCILREILEAKWMSRQVGLSSLENLIAIFVGLRLFSLAGLFLGPLALLLIRDLTELFTTASAIALPADCRKSDEMT